MIELVLVRVRVNGEVEWPFAAWAETDEAIALTVQLHIEAQTGVRPVAFVDDE